MNANMVTQIHGADGWYGGPFYGGALPGHATGIKLGTVATLTLTNNSVSMLSGGNARFSSQSVVMDGGNAIALSVSGGSANVVNNSCYQTVGGIGSEPNGEDGLTVGLLLDGSGAVTVTNNALISQGVGILVNQAAAPYLAHNDLWANAEDYSGVAPGATDLHLDPWFCNTSLHLGPNSPLIDAGTHAGIPGADMDGQMRPLDGNGDCVAIADIGADEYWSGLSGSVKSVDKRVATAGDVLTYRLTLVNPGSSCAVPGVSVTDPIPEDTTYIVGSIGATSGLAAVTDGVVHWSGTVFYGTPVALTYQVAVDPIVGPLAVGNRATVDDQVAPPLVLQATTLIDPLRHYLPIVFLAPE